RKGVAPGDDMRSGDDPKFLRPDEAAEAHKILDRSLVIISPTGAAVGEIGEPLDFGRHLSQPVKLGGGQQPSGRVDRGRQLGVGLGVGWQFGHGLSLLLIKSVYTE